MKYQVVDLKDKVVFESSSYKEVADYIKLQLWPKHLTLRIVQVVGN